MAESKYLKKVQGNGASTTLSASVSAVATSAPLTADTSFAGEGMLIIDEGQATEEFAYGTAKVGSAITILADDRGLEGGSAQAHASTATVKGIVTTGMWNNLITGVTNVLVNTTGALDTTKVVDLTTAQTLTNKTLTSPKINENVAVTSTATELNLLTGVTSLVTGTSTTTLTNKRVEPRVVTAASYTTDTGTSLSVATADVFQVTAQAGALLFNAPGGTPVAGQKLIIRIKDDGTARALTYNSVFRASSDLALPTTTVLSKTLYMGFIYNFTDTKWDLLAVLNNF